MQDQLPSSNKELSVELRVSNHPGRDLTARPSGLRARLAFFWVFAWSLKRMCPLQCPCS